MWVVLRRLYTPRSGYSPDFYGTDVSTITPDNQLVPPSEQSVGKLDHSVRARCQLDDTVTAPGTVYRYATLEQKGWATTCAGFDHSRMTPSQRLREGLN